jgi:hypothetical protein
MQVGIVPNKYFQFVDEKVSPFYQLLLNKFGQIKRWRLNVNIYKKTPLTHPITNAVN